MNKDQAKIVLALRAVTRLSLREEEDEESSWTMKQLFAPVKDTEREDATLAKYGRQKTWQRDFIQRLIDHGLVEKTRRGGHHVAYEGVEKGILREITAECVVEDDDVVFGSVIKWLVFPSSYETPEIFKVEEDEPEDDEVEIEDEIEDDEVALASLKLLNQVSDHLLEIRKSHEDLGNRFQSLEASQAQVLELLPSAIGDSIQVVHDRSFEKLEREVHAKLDAMAVALSALIDECRKLIANVSMADKVADLKSQLDVWNNIVQSIHAQSSDFAAGMETVLDVMGEIEENAAESTR